MPTRREWMLGGLAGLGFGLAACGGGSAEPSSPLDLEREAADRAVVKLAGGAHGVVALDERLVSIFEPGPQRTLVITPAGGGALRRVDAPEGWSLVDFALHPSGEISAVLTNARQVRLWRLARDGTLLRDQAFTDAQAALDPYYDAGGATDADALQPVFTRDAARVVALGEDVVLVLRSGLHTLLAYRLAHAPDAGFQRLWRTLVEPGSSMGGRFLTSGSHDVFDQLVNHIQFRVDIGADGVLAVGTTNAFGNVIFEAHSWHFGEPIAAELGVIVTRVAPDGTRLGSTVLDTQQLAELHALRAVPGGFALVGRVRSERRPDGSGWNAWMARVGADGSGGAVRVLDVDRGDVLFDIAALPDGGFLASGSTGYTQNPSGASISEEAAPLLLRLAPDGTLRERIAFAAGPRQNQLRALLRHGGRWFVAGLRDGPGTHSGDGDPARIRAQGLVARLAGLP